MNEKKEDICQQCGKHKANIFMTSFVDGKPVKKHICQRCYDSEEGVPSLSSSELISKLLGIIAPELRKAGKRKCPECGIDYLEFRQSFKFGCPRDYEVFTRSLDDLFMDLHGANRHSGRIPEGRAQTMFGGRQRLEILSRELEKAVEREDYEQAARLKNTIEQMERKGADDTEE